MQAVNTFNIQCRKPVKTDLYVDIQAVIDDKVKMLTMHKSQKEWLDLSQAIDVYPTTIKDMRAEVAE